MSDEEYTARRYNGAARRIKDFADDHTRSCIEEYDPTLTTAQAYVDRIREKIMAAIESGKGPLFRFDRLDQILPVVKAANLPLKAEIEYALRDAWGKSSYERCTAYDRMILNEAKLGGYVDLSSSQLFLGIIQRLGQQHGWTVNERGATEQAAVNEQAKRKRLIGSIVE